MNVLDMISKVASVKNKFKHTFANIDILNKIPEEYTAICSLSCNSEDYVVYSSATSSIDNDHYMKLDKDTMTSLLDGGFLSLKTNLPSFCFASITAENKKYFIRKCEEAGKEIFAAKWTFTILSEHLIRVSIDSTFSFELTCPPNDGKSMDITSSGMPNDAYHLMVMLFRILENDWKAKLEEMFSRTESVSRLSTYFLNGYFPQVRNYLKDVQHV